MKKIILFASAIILLSACAGKKATADKQMVGNDKDEHGCIGSAGYTWSEVRKDCIRLFEDGIVVKSTDVENENAYIVLSKDSLKAELFYSDGEKNQILDRKGDPQHGYSWASVKDNTSSVQFENKTWSIVINGKTKYQQKK